MKIDAIKVLHIISGLSTGGAERSLFNLLKETSKNRSRAEVVSLSTDGIFGRRLREIGIQVDILNLQPGIDFIKPLQQLHRIAKRFNPDIIQGWMYHGNFAASILSFSIVKKIPVCWNIRHSLYNINHEKNATKWVIRGNRMLSCQPNAIIYNSNISRKQHEAFGFCSTSGHVISNGFDIDTLKPSVSKRHDVREMLDIPQSAFVVGHVARYHPMKNHSAFLKAASKIAHKNKQFHIILCGNGVERRNASLYGCIPREVQEQFHLLGDRQDVHDIMRAMDLLCLSSQWGEGFPNVIGEAMALGVPCVATDIGECSQIIGNYGLIVHINDENELENAINHIIIMPNNERYFLGMNARTRIIENYSIDAMIDKYRVLYQRASSKNI